MKELLLISRAVRGDREALEQLVRLYYGKIYNYIFYRVMDKSHAEDLTQDVFVKLTRSIHAYLPTVSFTAYLYRIAHNTVVDHYRTTREEEDLSETVPAPDAYSGIEAKVDVQTMLLRLPPQQRECILLYYIQELTFREISQVLNIPIPTAKSRVQRGLAACKKMMEEET